MKIIPAVHAAVGAAAAGRSEPARIGAPKSSNTKPYTATMFEARLDQGALPRPRGRCSLLRLSYLSFAVCRAFCACGEPRVCSGQVFKKLIDAIKDLVNEANFDCSSSGMSLQAMVSIFCFSPRLYLVVRVLLLMGPGLFFLCFLSCAPLLGVGVVWVNCVRC